jgi:hypothetical protein
MSTRHLPGEPGKRTPQGSLRARRKTMKHNRPAKTERWGAAVHRQDVVGYFDCFNQRPKRLPVGAGES